MGRAKYIDPIIGTVGDEKDASFRGGGKTHPGACTPSGTVQFLLAKKPCAEFGKEIPENFMEE